MLGMTQSFHGILNFLAAQGPLYTFLAFRYTQKHHKVEVARALVAEYPFIAVLLSKNNAIVIKGYLKDLEEFHIIGGYFQVFLCFPLQIHFELFN